MADLGPCSNATCLEAVVLPFLVFFLKSSSFPKMITCMDALRELEYSEKGTFSARRQNLEFSKKNSSQGDSKSKPK